MNVSGDTIEQQVQNALDAGDYEEVERLGAILDAQDAEREARLRSTSALFSAALWYAAQGIKVFPLHPPGPCNLLDHHPDDELDGKKPFRGSRGFKDATTDQAQIRAWWDKRADSNIGTPTGLTFDVIDVDGPEGNAVILGEMYGRLPPTLGWVSTPRAGGRHLYVPPSGRGNKARIYPGIDYRGTGGYVVLPPSIGANGELYRWVRPLNTSTAGEIVA